MPRGNQRGYKGMSGYKGGYKILDNAVKASLSVALGKPKGKPRKATSKNPNYTPVNSGCLVVLTLIIMINLIIFIIAI